jgi:hypothetical protein
MQHWFDTRKIFTSGRSKAIMHTIESKSTSPVELIGRLHTHPCKRSFRRRAPASPLLFFFWNFEISKTSKTYLDVVNGQQVALCYFPFQTLKFQNQTFKNFKKILGCSQCCIIQVCIFSIRNTLYFLSSAKMTKFHKKTKSQLQCSVPHYSTTTNLEFSFLLSPKYNLCRIQNLHTARIQH